MAQGGFPNCSAINTSNSSPMEDSNSLYFFPNGDHSRLFLVYHVLNDNNYNTWSRAMLMALIVKNKVGLIDENIPCPNADNLLYNS
ncbi:hypothetical protein PVL29_022756 [Vitis rotundifolia]|uniref:Retrotransposon Copia-like N-terminal domain-containing protein n=1 Tax=Vitis rotundifolia TaxID=103349 RepID=A0AA38YWY7_VITRO|nr:hypothetical protein PVL29_022756 [Vitis rotundifolia]